MPDFGIITISHGRPDVLRLWCASIRRLREYCGWFPVIVVGDADHEAICDEYYIICIPMPNNPVEAKWNEAVENILIYNVDYVMISGSDDIISTPLLKDFIRLMGADFDMISINKVWFYCANGLYKGRARGIEQVYPFGVCKTIHRTVIEQAIPLWKMERGFSMDADCANSIKPYVNTVATAEGIVFDIKTSENMNKYPMLIRKSTSEKSWPFEVDSNLIRSILSEEEKQILKSL